MMGIMVATEEAWKKIGDLPEALGQVSSPDDVSLVLRGMRTLGTRLAVHGQNGLKVAKWLQGRPEVKKCTSPGWKITRATTYTSATAKALTAC